VKWPGLILGILLLTPAIAASFVLSTGTVSLAIVQPEGTFVLIALAMATIAGATLILLSIRAMLRTGE
jgi:hypothetical protein